MSGLVTCHLKERPNRQAPSTPGAGLPQGESDPVAGFPFTSKNLVDSGDQHRPQVVRREGLGGFGCRRLGCTRRTGGSGTLNCRDLRGSGPGSQRRAGCGCGPRLATGRRQSHRARWLGERSRSAVQWHRYRARPHPPPTRHRLKHPIDDADMQVHMRVQAGAEAQKKEEEREAIR